MSLPLYLLRMLPLDKSFFVPFKAFFNREVSVSLRPHPGRPAKEYPTAALLGAAARKPIAPLIVSHGFQHSDICPLNPGISSELDFAPVSVTYDSPAQPTLTEAAEEPVQRVQHMARRKRHQWISQS